MGCIYLFECVFLFSLEVELLDYMLVLLCFWFFEEPPDCFPQWLHEFTIPPAVHKRCLFSLHSYQHLLLLVFLLTAVLTGMRWYLIVALICISLMISDVEHLFMYLLAVFMSSLENVGTLNWLAKLGKTDVLWASEWWDLSWDHTFLSVLS